MLCSTSGCIDSLLFHFQCVGVWCHPNMGEGTQIGYEFMQNPGHINFQKSDNCTNKSRDIQIFNMQNCPSGSGHLWQNSINCTEKKADKFASRILSKPCPWDQKLRSWFARNECAASVSEFFFLKSILDYHSWIQKLDTLPQPMDLSWGFHSGIPTRHVRNVPKMKDSGSGDVAICFATSF